MFTCSHLFSLICVVFKYSNQYLKKFVCNFVTYIQFSFPYCLFVSNSQVIRCKDCLQNDLYCVRWDVKLYSTNQPMVMCQHGLAAGYLAELCKPVANIDGHRHLRSAGRGQLDVPRVRLSTYGARAFCYTGLSAWDGCENV